MVISWRDRSLDRLDAVPVGVVPSLWSRTVRCAGRGGTTRPGRRVSWAEGRAPLARYEGVLGEGADALGPTVVQGCVNLGEGGLEFLSLRPAVNDCLMPLSVMPG
jgi:hypothetical protein